MTLKHTLGFTLFELLVVMMIISVITISASLSVDAFHHHQETAFAHHLLYQLRMVKRRALMDERSYRVHFSTDEMSIAYYDGARWHTITSEPGLQPSRFPQGITAHTDDITAYPGGVFTATAVTFYQADQRLFVLKISPDEVTVTDG